MKTELFLSSTDYTEFSRIFHDGKQVKAEVFEVNAFLGWFSHRFYQSATFTTERIVAALAGNENVTLSTKEQFEESKSLFVNMALGLISPSKSEMDSVKSKTELPF